MLFQSNKCKINNLLCYEMTIVYEQWLSVYISIAEVFFSSTLMNKEVHSSIYRLISTNDPLQLSAVNSEVSVFPIRDLRTFHFSSASMCTCSGMYVCMQQITAPRRDWRGKARKNCGQSERSTYSPGEPCVKCVMGLRGAVPCNWWGVQHAGAISS